MKLWPDPKKPDRIECGLFRQTILRRTLANPIALVGVLVHLPLLAVQPRFAALQHAPSEADVWEFMGFELV